MTNPDLDPEVYPPIDPRVDVPDAPGALLPDPRVTIVLTEDGLPQVRSVHDL
ncbi:hypothetical protein AB0893_19810 [Micromonospora aurantiaca]|uniref:hypothetical protein n=1 Tax=Micromonospora aurantiaca (nom. illeg.) TaxID=47850 RepID=UPI003456D970